MWKAFPPFGSGSLCFLQSTLDGIFEEDYGSVDVPSHNLIQAGSLMGVFRDIGAEVSFDVHVYHGTPLHRPDVLECDCYRLLFFHL